MIKTEAEYTAKNDTLSTEVKSLENSETKPTQLSEVNEIEQATKAALK